MRQAAVRTRDLRLDNRPDPFFSYRFDERPVIALLLFCIVDRELATLVYRKLQSAILASNMPSEPGSERAFLPCSCALETEMYPTDTYRNDNGSLAASCKSRPPKAASASGGCVWRLGITSDVRTQASARTNPSSAEKIGPRLLVESPSAPAIDSRVRNEVCGCCTRQLSIAICASLSE
jgi:hypothetical protein